MNSRPDETEQALTDYLKGDSDLSAVYQTADKITAPEHLSARIKAMAREEAAQPRKHRNWFIPTALAASLVLAVIVYFTVSRQTVEQKVPPVAKQEQESTPAPQQQAPKVADNKPIQPKPQEKIVVKEPVPDHIKDLLQNTSRHDTADYAYPSAKELRSWSVQQWVKKIKQLRNEGKHAEAARYITDFNKYQPQQDIELLLEGN
ncbi:MAG: hypothetical protein OEZ39_16915 [Gammaproteobacteria bacterium]|nr:hypothetical protein [Gammaproteobacteria bacterium]MDH5653543.1 hypothetical protein [Gammaproteobacteria bacterium]